MVRYCGWIYQNICGNVVFGNDPEVILGERISIAENNISNANLHLMFDKIVIEETDEGLNLDLRLKSPFISKKREPLLKKYMIVDNEVLSVGA